MVHYPGADEASQLMYVSPHRSTASLILTILYRCRPTLSYQRLQTTQVLSDQELYDRIRRTVSNKHELQVLESFLIFNKSVHLHFLPRIFHLIDGLVYRHVLKTNFYQPTKVALSFRLAPDFLPEVEYPKKPFGVFFVIGG